MLGEQPKKKMKKRKNQLKKLVDGTVPDFEKSIEIKPVNLAKPNTPASKPPIKTTQYYPHLTSSIQPLIQA